MIKLSVIFSLFQVSSPPVTYSSKSPRDDSFPQDNEIDSNGITFHMGYNWHVGSYGEVSSISLFEEISFKIHIINVEKKHL